FKIGLAAFIVPFMFFFSPELLLEAGTTVTITLAVITALIGVYLLAAAVQAWIFGKPASWYSRIIMITAAIMFMLSGIQTDLVGFVLVALVVVIQKYVNKSDPPQKSIK